MPDNVFIPSTSNGVFIAADTQFEILGFNMYALVDASKASQSNSNIRLLVMPDMEMPAQNVTFGEVLEKIGTTFGLGSGIGDIKAQASSILSYIGFSLDSKIVLNQAFVFYDGTAQEGEKLEYAFSIAIDTASASPTAAIPDEKLFAIKRVAFSVWNSTRPVIKEAMGLTSIEELFNTLEGKKDAIAAKSQAWLTAEEA